MLSSKMRKAYIEFICQFEPNAVLTLATNQNWHIERLTEQIGHFSARMDDWALGTTWAKKPMHKRANGIFFIEHVASNIHAHGFVHFPYGTETSRLFATTEFWSKLCPAGSLKLEPIWGLDGAAWYCTKEFKDPYRMEEQTVLLADFMSEKTRASLAN